jgi:signal transduction histidine kinase/Tfp pilus assembly protein PilF
MRNKKYFIPVVVFSFIILSIFSLLVFQKKTERQTVSANANIKRLLSQSAIFLGYSPEMASQKANEALNLAKKLNNNEFIIQSIELLGEVKNIQGNTKEAFALYLNAYDLAVKGNFPREICKITIEIGKVYYNWGQYDTSLFYFDKAKTIAENIKELELKSTAITFIGKYYCIKGKFDQAMLFFQRALEIAREIKDYKQIAFTLNTEGKYYIGEGNLTSALQCYQEAYTASEKVNDKLLLADVCNHLGGLYLLTNQYEKSLEFHRKALSFRNIMNNPDGIAKSFNNIGKAYLELNKNDSALIYFNKSLRLCKQTGYKKGLVKALTNIGKIYNLQHNELKSEQSLLQAFEISKNAGYNLGIAESAQALGNLYLYYGSTKKATSYFEVSLSNLKNLDFDELLQINYKGLYECYNVFGDYKKALHYHELLLETEKKLLNVENHRQLAILQITFNTERKEKDNQVLRKDNELKAMTIKRKSIFLWLIVALLFSSILLCLNIYNRFYSKIKANRKLKELNSKITIQNKALEKLNKELNTANEEKDKLFSIIAHELRNPLYWFQNLAEVLSRNYRIMKPEKIQKSLFSLDESAKNAFHLMDNLLHWSRSRLNRITPKKAKYSLLSVINESLKMYETIIQYKEIELKISVAETTQVYVDTDLLGCVIRNLVSNAIKYTPNKGIISIESSEGKDFVNVIVGDTGTGIICKNFDDIFKKNNHISHPGLMQEKGSGLGLKLCKEFVELNGGDIWVTNSDEMGTRFMFTVQNGNCYGINQKKLELTEVE